jgi:hypothetical protein
MTCRFGVGDNVDYGGKCWRVAATVLLGGVWQCRLQADDDGFTVQCSDPALIPCTHMTEAVPRKSAERAARRPSLSATRVKPRKPKPSAPKKKKPTRRSGRP